MVRPQPHPKGHEIPFGRLAVVVLLGLAMLIAFKFSASVNTATEDGVIMRLPQHIGRFMGKPQDLSEGEKYVLPKDTELVKESYSDPFGDEINAQIVLAGAEKRSIHRPELCLPAQGWSIDGRESIPVKLSDGRNISVMKVSISRPLEISPGISRSLKGVYCYWFVGNGVTTPSHITRLLLTSWDRVVNRKNHRWAYVAVSAPVLEGFRSNGRNADDTMKMVADFISQMAPVVMKKQPK